MLCLAPKHFVSSEWCRARPSSEDASVHAALTKMQMACASRHLQGCQLALAGAEPPVVKDIWQDVRACCPHTHERDQSDPVVQTSISLPFITATADGPKHIESNLSRAKFEELASDLLDRVRIPVEQALKDANLAVSDINEVILVGGSTRIPAVQVCRQPAGWNSLPWLAVCRHD